MKCVPSAGLNGKVPPAREGAVACRTSKNIVYLLGGRGNVADDTVPLFTLTPGMYFCDFF